jgi:TPR repeat protein
MKRSPHHLGRAFTLIELLGGQRKDSDTMKTMQWSRMANLAILLGLVFQTAAAEMADSAAGLVGDSGDLRQLTFEGAKTFSAEELRDGLKWTPDFLEISHPMAPRGEFLKAVERKLLFGYQHGGFPEARISVQTDAKSSRIIVKVEEGPRYVCGRVKVSGTKKAVSSAITRRLTVESAPAASAGRAFDFTDQAPASPVADGAEPAAPGQIEALWVKGQPAPFSEYDLRWLEWQVRQALGDQGFFFPEVHVAIQRDAAGGKAELEVTVLKEGPRRTIGSIEITGNKKNSREALLRYLDLKPGMELTRERVSGIEDRLWRAARFLAYQVTPGQPDTAGRVALHVEVSECDQAPPVDQEFSPVEQAMLNMRQWLARMDRRQEEMILDLTMDAVRLPGLEMIITPQSGLAVLEKPAPQDALSQRPSGFILKPNLAEFYATGRDRKLVVPWYEQQIWTRISLVSEKPEGESAAHHFNFSMGAGFKHDEEAAKVPYQLQVTLYPVVCVSMAHFTNCAYWFSGGMLICSNATTLCRLEARSGRPIELSWKDQVKDKTFQAQVRFQRKVFRGRVKEIEKTSAHLANAYRTNAPLSTSLGFLTEELLSSKLLAQLLSDHVSSNALARLPALTGKLNLPDILSPLDSLSIQDRATAKGQEKFLVPEIGDSSGAGSIALIAGWFTQFSDQLLPAHSWLLTLAHEGGLVVQGKGKYTAQAFGAIYESPDTGPLGYWAAASLVAQVQPGPARRFAARGLERLSAADFRRDCQLFFQDNSPLGQCLGKLAAALGNLDDEDLGALVAGSSPASQDFLRESARALRQAKGQPVIKSLAPALDVYWEKELRQEIAGALTKLDGQMAVKEGFAFWQAQPPDYVQAARCFREAAERGNADGQNDLGVMYRDGQGVEKDYTKAAEWFRRAAEQGNVEAQNNLGWAYRNGQGVGQDYGEAARWLRKAAEQSHAAAQRVLGWMYQHGQGMDKDTVEAAKWYRKAAEQGDAWGQDNLGWLYSKGWGVGQDYPEALRWFRKAADQGNALAQVNLGVMYRDGLGVEKDYAKALEWLRKAAEQDDPWGQNNLGWMYAAGEGVTQDAAEAAKWYRKAAEQNRKAADAGDVQASKSLAWLLATCVIPEVRDGSGATSFAEKAVAATNRKDPEMLDTLAAACAEAGQFAKAAGAEKEAIALVSDEKTKKEYLSRLKLYESNTPYREHEP